MDDAARDVSLVGHGSTEPCPPEHFDVNPRTRAACALVQGG